MHKHALLEHYQNNLLPRTNTLQHRLQMSMYHQDNLVSRVLYNTPDSRRITSSMLVQAEEAVRRCKRQLVQHCAVLTWMEDNAV